MTRRLLLPQTYRKIPLRDQPQLPRTFESSLHASCIAYRSAEDWANYYRKHQKNAEAIVHVSMRDRQYANLKPMLETLVVPVTDEQWAAWLNEEIL